MRRLILLCFLALTMQVTGMERKNPDPSQEKALKFPKPLPEPPDFLIKSDNNYLKKALKNQRSSRDSTPFRMHRSAPNLASQAIIAAVNLSAVPCPSEKESSHLPQKKAVTLLRRSNSAKQLLVSHVSKESSQQKAHNDINQKKETPEEIKQNIQELEFEKKLFAHLKEKINKLSKKIAEDPRVECFTYIKNHKYAQYKLLFIRHKNNKIQCFVDCPLLYASNTIIKK